MEPAPFERKAEDAISPVLNALRLPSDEVQFSRVLAAVCADQRVASRFARLLLRHVREGNAGAGERLGAAPELLECTAERLMDLSRVGDRRLFWRAVRGGRADLWFARHDWQLVAELKINARIDPGQIRNYLQKAHALVVVRRSDATKDLDATITGHRYWLGHVTWNSIVEGLYDLVPGEAYEGEWRGLFDIMVRDGDFAENRPRTSRELEATGRLLSDVKDPVLERLRMLLRQRHASAAEPLCERLRTFAVGAYKPWAMFDIGYSKNFQESAHPHPAQGTLHRITDASTPLPG